MYEQHSLWLAALIRGEANRLAPDVPGRLVLLRAQFRASQDGGMIDLIRRAEDARAADMRAADVGFLQSLIDGTVDYFANDLYERLEPLYAKYGNDPAMLAMFNQAATVYGDAVVAAAEWCLAGLEAQDAIDRAMGREQWD